MLQRSIAKLLVPLSAFTYAKQLNADEFLDKQKEALVLIQETANEICTRVPVEGSGTNLTLSGEASVELNKLLEKFVDLGIVGIANFADHSYQGVIRRQLAGAISASDQCRLTVFTDLSSRLLGSPINTAIVDPRISTTSLPTLHPEAQYKNELVQAVVMSAAQSSDSSTLTISVLVKNISNQNVYLIAKSSGAGSAVDDRGQSYRLWRINGVNTRHTSSPEPSEFTLFTSGSIQTINFIFQTNNGNSKEIAEIASFAVDFQLGLKDRPIQDFSLGISNIVLLDSASKSAAQTASPFK